MGGTAELRLGAAARQDRIPAATSGPISPATPRRRRHWRARSPAPASAQRLRSEARGKTVQEGGRK
jgi:hypothetical protein